MMKKRKITLSDDLHRALGSLIFHTIQDKKPDVQTATEIFKIGHYEIAYRRTPEVRAIVESDDPQTALLSAILNHIKEAA